MSTTTDGRHRGALEDSESMLRQVSGALEDMGASAELEAATEAGAPGLGRLPKLATTLIQAYVEINSLITMLKDSRSVLEQAAMSRLHKTTQHLADVSSATETAASGMLDGVDRTLGLVDKLQADRDDGSDGAETADEIRDELHTLVMLLQFQDITSQQLGYASSVLVDLEDRLARISTIFGEECFTESAKAEIDDGVEEAMDSSETCDPNASLGDAQARQSLADSIFG